MILLLDCVGKVFPFNIYCLIFIFGSAHFISEFPLNLHEVSERSEVEIQSFI